MKTVSLLSIDVGTTGIRAALFSRRGELLATVTTACPHETPQPGWAEASAEVWWKEILRAIKTLGTQAPLSNVAAVAVVGQAPTAVLVDGEGAVVRPAILWLDTRASVEAKELGTAAYYLGPKIAWLARHEPSSLGRTRWLLQSHSFIAFRLTGEVAIDPSTAALCLPLFDLETLSWRTDIASTAIQASQLPPLRRAHEVLGAVTQEAARATGLRAGTPVMVGGADFAATALGAGVLHEGEACLMLGTAGNLLVPRKTAGTDPRLIHAYHVGADCFLSLGGTLSGGAQEWLRHALARTMLFEGDSAVHGALAPYETLDAEAAQIPTGSEGLIFLPYLQGERTPIWNVDARASYIGLGLHHGRGHLWRSLLEGIALSLADCQQVLEADDVKLTRVIAADGGGKSALFRQILCNALGIPLDSTPAAGGTIAGAAVLAGLGAGVLASVDEARAWRGEAVRHEPDLVAHRRYGELLELRRTAYEGLKDVFASLKAFRPAER